MQTKKNTSEKTLLLKEVSVLFTIQLKMVQLPTGNIWRKSGIIVTSMNSESNQKIMLLCLLKPQETQSKIEKECAKFSSKISKFHNSTYLSKLFSHFTPQEEPLVVLQMLVMVLPTLFQFSKVILYLTVSKEMILPVDNLLTISVLSSEKLVTTLSLVPKKILLELSKKNIVMLLLIMPKKWKNSKTPQNMTSNTNYQMDKS